MIIRGIIDRPLYGRLMRERRAMRNSEAPGFPAKVFVAFSRIFVQDEDIARNSLSQGGEGQFRHRNGVTSIRRTAIERVHHGCLSES